VNLSKVLIFLLFSAQASGATVVKCVDSKGQVTFVQHRCPAATEKDSMISVESQRPSGAGPAVKIAEPRPIQANTSVRRSYNHCGNLTQVDIAWATAHGKIQVGMTGDDVRGIWGAPTQINHTASGQQWVYPIDDYRNRYLYVDNQGCFTYWN